MKARVMTLAMSLAFLTLGHPSQAADAGQRTIAELRRFTMTENEWAYYADGMGAALAAVDGQCTYPFSTGEAAAYLRFTAAEWKTVIQAIKEFWQSHGCDTSWGLITSVTRLLAACTSTDLRYLQTLSQDTSEDEMAKIVRQVATGRLRELGQMPKIPPQKQ